MKQHHKSQWWQHWSCLSFFLKVWILTVYWCSLQSVGGMSCNSCSTHLLPACICDICGWKISGYDDRWRCHPKQSGEFTMAHPKFRLLLDPLMTFWSSAWSFLEEKKNIYIIMHPIQLHGYCITRTTSRNDTLLPACQSNHIQKTLLALVIHRRKSQDSNTRLTPYSYFSNCFSCKKR